MIYIPPPQHRASLGLTALGILTCVVVGASVALIVIIGLGVGR